MVNNETVESQDTQSVMRLHLYIYILSTPLIEDLTNIVNMTANNECYGWAFLINTNIPMDCFVKIIQLLLANDKMKIAIIEENLKDDVADTMMTQFKRLQAIRYYENRDSKSIQYLLLSNSNCLANNIDQFLFSKILNFSNFQEFCYHYLYLSPCFPFNNTCCCKQ